MFLELIGWSGGILFAVCAVPQAIKSYKDGEADSLSTLTLWMWFLGELFMTIYVLGKVGFNGPLLLNYIFNLICVCIILRYKHKPRRVKDASN